MTGETRLWKWLTDGRLPPGHYSRVESPETSPGIPDVFYQIPAAQGWIELKFDRSEGTATYPFNSDDKGLHVSQRAWMRDYLVAGGKNLWICAESNRVICFLPGMSFGCFNQWSWQHILDNSKLTLMKGHRDTADIRSRLQQLLEMNR
jgi:hypothetical protein